MNKEKIVLYFKGIAIGSADLIPGVSGGTVALITRIYDRLLAALITLNFANLKLLLLFQWKLAFQNIAWKDLLNIGLGVMTAILLLSRVIHFILSEFPVELFSYMFGLILTSSIFLFFQIKEKKIKTYFILLFGILTGFFVVNIVPVSTPESFIFIFFCGFISISAMMLPGISGSFILLILGKYFFILSALKDIFILQNLIIVLIFASGAATGLLMFSKVLHFILKRYREGTICFLVGIMLGTLWKIWPWKQVIQQITQKGKIYVIEDQNILPNLSTEILFPFLLFLAGIFTIAIIEKIYALSMK